MKNRSAFSFIGPRRVSAEVRLAQKKPRRTAGGAWLRPIIFGPLRFPQLRALRPWTGNVQFPRRPRRRSKELDRPECLFPLSLWRHLFGRQFTIVIFTAADCGIEFPKQSANLRHTFVFGRGCRRIRLRLRHGRLRLASPPRSQRRCVSLYRQRERTLRLWPALNGRVDAG